MATTTNYGWTTPDDTALVKDGAAAIRTLGSSVDTTTKNLNPETTLGDIAYRSSTANVKTRLGIGSTGQVLTVSGGVPSWATPGGGSMTELASGSLSGTSVTLSSIDQTYQHLYVYMIGAVAASGIPVIRLNGDSGSNYSGNSFNDAAAPYSASDLGIRGGNDAVSSSANTNIQSWFINNYALSTINKHISTATATSSTALANNYFGFGVYSQTTAITSLVLRVHTSSTMTAGTYKLFGVK